MSPLFLKYMLLIWSIIWPQVTVTLPGPFVPQAVGGEPTFTKVQTGCAGTRVSSGTTMTCTFGAAPTAGNAVVCMADAFPLSITFSTVQDGNSNAFTKSTNSPSNSNVSAEIVFIYYRFYGGGDTPTATITATTTGTAFSFSSQLACEELHRSAGSWSVDTDVAGTSAVNGTAINTPSITPSVAGELLFSAVYGAGGVTAVNSPWTAGAGFSSGNGQSDGYILSGSSGAIATNMTQASQGWNSMMIAIK